MEQAFVKVMPHRLLLKSVNVLDFVFNNVEDLLESTNVYTKMATMNMLSFYKMIESQPGQRILPLAGSIRVSLHIVLCRFALFYSMCP